MEEPEQNVDHLVEDLVEADYVIDLNSSPPMEEPEQNVNHLVEDLVEADYVIDLNSSQPMEEPEQNVDHLVEDPAPVEADNVIDLNSSPPMEEPEQNVDHLVEDPAPVEAENVIGLRKRRKKLTIRQKELIFYALRERSSYGKLRRNATKEISEMFSIHIRTAQKIWKEAKENPGHFSQWRK
ncbi:hypothetical protein HID58_019703 [Brassica napus]|uniref:DUF7769 domain-containing protein n=1 Tax=Brassica napus TaxID=3708 RepID=A0ABQ8DDI1_BRANA|nr:hypothetical protein HID58_019703 [Brassica napus]